MAVVEEEVEGGEDVDVGSTPEEGAEGEGGAEGVVVVGEAVQDEEGPLLWMHTAIITPILQPPLLHRPILPHQPTINQYHRPILLHKPQTNPLSHSCNLPSTPLAFPD